jgi:hypothetical protein
MAKKLHKAVSFIISLLVLLISSGHSAQTRFSLVVREGFGSMKVGDLNTTLGSYNRNPALEVTRKAYPDRCIGDFLPLASHFAQWEVEIQGDVWGGFSLGVSVSEKVHLDGRSSLLYTIVDFGGTQTMNQTLTSDIYVSPPLHLSLLYSHRLIGGFHLFANVGLDLYRARMTQGQDWYSRYPSSAIQVMENSWDVKGRCHGYHYGLGLEYQINRRMSLMAESQWRHARVSALSGVEQWNVREYDPEGTLVNMDTHSKQGPLFHYFGEDLDYGGGHEKLIVNEDFWQLGADSPYDIRKAFLDLGGLSFKIGLKIRLF